MKKISIIYGSTTGNTEAVANLLKDLIKDSEVTVTSVDKANADLVKNADLILYGSSTWGYGDIQDDFLEYYEAMNSDLLQGKDVAVFGCGDSVGFGDVFCEAVKLISEKVIECGANVIAEPLKVDGDVDDNASEIEKFAASLV